VRIFRKQKIEFLRKFKENKKEAAQIGFETASFFSICLTGLKNSKINCVFFNKVEAKKSLKQLSKAFS